MISKFTNVRMEHLQEIFFTTNKSIVMTHDSCFRMYNNKLSIADFAIPDAVFFVH